MSWRRGGAVLGFEFIRVGSGGHGACVRCGPAPTPVVHIDVETIVAAIREAVKRASSPGPNVMLGGVDAFGHPALPELVGAAVREGAVRIGLETDGGAVAAGGNAAGALHAGVRHLRVRYVDRKAIDGIAAWTAAARAAGVDAVATAVIPVCAHMIDPVAETVAELAEAGVAGVTIDASGLSVSPGVTANIVAACDTGMVNGVWVEVQGAPDLLPESHRLHRAGEVTSHGS